MTIVLLGVQAIPECAAQSAEPYVPQPQSVGIRSQVDGGAAIVTVSVQLPNPGWGQFRLS